MNNENVLKKIGIFYFILHLKPFTLRCYFNFYCFIIIHLFDHMLTPTVAP